MNIYINNKTRALIESALKMAKAQANSINARSPEREQYIAHFNEALQALSDAETNSQPVAPANQPPHLRHLAQRAA